MYVQYTRAWAEVAPSSAVGLASFFFFFVFTGKSINAYARSRCDAAAILAWPEAVSSCRTQLSDLR